MDASQQKQISKVEKERLEYNNLIDSIMGECLKDPKALLNAEALASHVSTATDSQNVDPKNKSGTNSSKSGAGKGSNKMKSS